MTSGVTTTKRLRILTALLVVVAAVSTACGGDSTSSEESGRAESSQQIETVPFTTGEMSIEVPPGWSVRGANDSMDGYVDETARMDLIYLVKNGDGEVDVFANPGFQVTYYDESVSMMGADKSMYEDTADLDPIELDNYTWTGFTGENFGKPLAILFANPDQGDGDQFQVAVWLDMGDGQKITLEDEDVLTILSSIKPG